MSCISRNFPFFLSSFSSFSQFSKSSSFVSNKICFSTFSKEFINSTKIDSTSEKRFQQIAKRFPNTFFYAIHGEWRIKTTPQTILPLLTFLKSHTNTAYNQLRDIVAIDFPERKLRFEVVYFLLSLQTGRRVCVSVSVSEGTALPSVTSLYPSAGWYERETWDRFGIFFRNHPDLRRRLTDYGFKGHPLRKDFPLTGFVEVRYDDFRKRILYEGISLSQEYRIFTLENHWKNLIFLIFFSFLFYRFIFTFFYRGVPFV